MITPLAAPALENEAAARDFLARYGPWAVIAGASEGTGRAYAQLLAQHGLSLVLIARRQAPLDRLAPDLRERFGVKCVTAAIDLGQPDASVQVIAAVDHRDVGLYIGNAGADPNGSRFLDADVEAWRSLVTRNVLTTMLCSYHFAARMRDRGRGGLLLANSFACYGGGRFMACYTATKAFDLNFAESLWSELKPLGIDVLSLVMGMTATPAFQALLERKGLDEPPGIATPEDVARFALANLGNGPVQNWGVPEDVALGGGIGSAAQRRERIAMIDAGSSNVFGN